MHAPLVCLDENAFRALWLCHVSQHDGVLPVLGENGRYNNEQHEKDYQTFLAGAARMQHVYEEALLQVHERIDRITALVQGSSASKSQKH